MSRKKKNVIFISSMIGLVAIAIILGAAYSFFITKDVAKNSLTMGNQDIDLLEPKWDPEDAKLIVSGKTIVKDPTLKGVAGNNYGRLVVEFYDLDTSEKITKVDRVNKIKELLFYDKSYDKTSTTPTTNLNPESNYSKEELNSLISSNKIIKFYNTNDFTLDDSRSTDTKFVFNYKNILHTGEEKVLFTNLVIPIEYTENDLNLLGNFKIKIHAEAIQSENIDSMDEAFKALDGEYNE